MTKRSNQTFLRLRDQRMKKALEAIEQLGSLSHSRYEKTTKQWDGMVRVLTSAVDDLRMKGPKNPNRTSTSVRRTFLKADFNSGYYTVSLVPSSYGYADYYNLSQDYCHSTFAITQDFVSEFNMKQRNLAEYGAVLVGCRLPEWKLHGERPNFRILNQYLLKERPLWVKRVHRSEVLRIEPERFLAEWTAIQMDGKVS